MLAPSADSRRNEITWLIGQRLLEIMKTLFQRLQISEHTVRRQLVVLNVRTERLLHCCCVTRKKGGMFHGTDEKRIYVLFSLDSAMRGDNCEISQVWQA